MTDKPSDDLTVICIGSNTGDKQTLVSKAMERLRKWCDIVSSGEQCLSPDDSGLGEPYINVVATVNPHVNLDTMHEAITALEKEFGRVAGSKAAGIMPLDIDIIVWHGNIIDAAQYTRSYFRRAYATIR